MIKIFKVKKDFPLDKTQRMCLLKFLSAEEKSKIHKFKFKKDQETATVSRFLFRTRMAELLGEKAEKLIIRYNKYGRPKIANKKNKNFDYNISHSGDWIILAYGQGMIGVDIEKIKPIDTDVVNTCFCSVEIDHIKKNSKEELENFYRFWVLKESFIKAIGKGVSFPLKECYFSLDNNKIKIKFNKKSIYSIKKWHFKFFYCDDSHLSAVCSNKKEPMKTTLIDNYEKLTGDTNYL